MKVHITATSEVNPEILNEVHKTLSKVQGPIKFSQLRPAPNNEIENVIGQFENCQPLVFNVFFRICDHYRAIRSINIEDYVIVLTNLTNKGLWFSSFNNKNIFIYVGGWSDLTTTPLKNVLAYQVISNIFHSLAGIDPEKFEDDPNAHIKSIGCISDFCNDKSEIMLKFRTGWICNDCLENVLNNVADKEIVKHMHSTIQYLRNAFVHFQFEETIEKPLKLSIDDNLKLYIGYNEIELEALQKTITTDRQNLNFVGFYFYLFVYQLLAVFIFVLLKTYPLSK